MIALWLVHVCNTCSNNCILSMYICQCVTHTLFMLFYQLPGMPHIISIQDLYLKSEIYSTDDMMGTVIGTKSLFLISVFFHPCFHYIYFFHGVIGSVL